MKNSLIKIICIVAALAMCHTGASAEEKFFEEASKIQGVTTVYVGPAMMRLTRGATLVSGVGEIANFIDDIKSIEIITSGDPKTCPEINELCQKAIRQHHMELISEVTNANDKVMIYGNMARADKGVINGITIVADSENQYYAIYIMGKVDLAALMEEYEPFKLNGNASPVNPINNTDYRKKRGNDTIIVEEIPVVD